LPEQQDNEKGRRLRQAAIAGDTAAAAALLDAGVPADASDSVGYTALMLAAKHGHIDLVRLLCRHDANPNARNRFAGTPLSYAVEHEDAAAVRTMLEHGGRALAVAAQEESGHLDRPLLERAIGSGNVEMVRAFLDHGANPAAAQGGYPLLVGAEAGQPMIRLLLDQGADVRRRYGTLESTLLIEAASAADLATVRLLLEAGSDVNAATKEGTTALMYAAGRQQDAIVRLLLEAGADVNAATTRERMTPLMWAAYDYDHVPNWFGAPRRWHSWLGFYGAPGGSERTVHLLLGAGANAAARTTDGQTPLHRTSSGVCVGWLLAAGAEREARDSEGYTPLLRAAENARPDAVRALLEAGADTTARTPPEGRPKKGKTEGKTALALAQQAYREATGQVRGLIREWPDPEEPARLEAVIARLRQAGVRQ
jgi:ankyrin repeat protein